jgi:hypothetical protein
LDRVRCRPAPVKLPWLPSLDWSVVRKYLWEQRCTLW